MLDSRRRLDENASTTLRIASVNVNLSYHMQSLYESRIDLLGYCRLVDRVLAATDRVMDLLFIYEYIQYTTPKSRIPEGLKEEVPCRMIRHE